MAIRLKYVIEIKSCPIIFFELFCKSRFNEGDIGIYCYRLFLNNVYLSPNGWWSAVYCLSSFVASQTFLRYNENDQSSIYGFFIIAREPRAQRSQDRTHNIRAVGNGEMTVLTTAIRSQLLLKWFNSPFFIGLIIHRAIDETGGLGATKSDYPC